MGSICNVHWREEICVPILIRKPIGKRPLAGTRYGEQDVIKTDFVQMRWEDAD
jgi:hypothetical protein